MSKASLLVKNTLTKQNVLIRVRGPTLYCTLLFLFVRVGHFCAMPTTHAQNISTVSSSPLAERAPRFNKIADISIQGPGANIPIGCNVCLQLDDRVAGNTVNFVCNPLGAMPPLDYFWSFNNMEVRRYTGVNASQTELVGEQAGNYTCRVENVVNVAELTSILYGGLRTCFLVILWSLYWVYPYKTLHELVR